MCAGRYYISMKLTRLHKTLNRMMGMSDEAWSVLRGALIMCCALLFSAFVIIIDLGEINAGNYNLYRSAVELAESPPALLFTAAIVSVCIEERVNPGT